MLSVWRVCRRKWSASAFTGEGAKLAGGRWNHKGTKVVYCAGSLSLATLEIFVHLDPGELPDDMVVIRAAVPDDVAIERIAAASLPRGWRRVPSPDALRDIGTKWVASGATAVLAVPSAIVPNEDNWLLNPAHPDFAKILTYLPEPFGFDPRMRKDASPPPKPPKPVAPQSA